MVVGVGYVDGYACGSLAGSEEGRAEDGGSEEQDG